MFFVKKFPIVLGKSFGPIYLGMSRADVEKSLKAKPTVRNNIYYFFENLLQIEYKMILLYLFSYIKTRKFFHIFTTTIFFN